jgi:Raf kinase inhibitor-like YbhB/YbcL family protein
MRKVLSVALAMAMAVAIGYAQPKGGPPGGKGGGGKGGGKGGFSLPPMIKISVEGATDMGQFPAANAGQGKGSPAISWTQVPAGTQSFALLFHDPDPVIGNNASTDVTHWIVYNIPGTATGLPANVPAGTLPDGTMQGLGITNQQSYFGPGPPAGHGPHHYTLEIWALNAKLDLPAGATRDAFMKAMDGKVIGKGVFIATFENK